MLSLNACNVHKPQDAIAVAYRDYQPKPLGNQAPSSTSPMAIPAAAAAAAAQSRGWGIVDVDLAHFIMATGLTIQTAVYAEASVVLLNTSMDCTDDISVELDDFRPTRSVNLSTGGYKLMELMVANGSLHQILEVSSLNFMSKDMPLL